MMKTDIGSDPLQEGGHFHIARRFQRCIGIAPLHIFPENNAWEIMLRIKQIRAQHLRQKERQEKGKEPGKPTIMYEQEHRYSNM